MNEIRLNELLNKIYYEYLDSHEAEEFIIYFKRLKQDKENLQSKIDKAIEYCEEVIKEHNNGEYNVSTVELAVKEHKGNIENVLDILKEDK